jgi:tetratricopeptide (TPR) repeat protein
MKLKQFDNAKEYFTKALENAEKSRSLLHICNSYNELAIYCFQNGNLSDAEVYNRKALEIREQNKYTGAVITSCVNLGEIYIKQSRWDMALEILNKGLALSEQLKLKPKLYQVHFLLSQVYKGKNELHKSLYHYEQFHELREKVLQEDNARKLSDARLIFEAEQTRKENIIIKKQKEEIQRKNIELQETIDELTITRISRKAKVLTFIIAIGLFFIEDAILHFTLDMVSTDSYFLSMAIKIAIIFSLSPINKTIEKSLVKKVIKKKKIIQPVPLN